MRTAARLAAGLAAAGLLLAAGCPLATVVIKSPRNGLLVDDPGVAVEVKAGRNFVHDGTAVRVDGVDLAAALGLVPPFAGAGGLVTIGVDVVTVSGFTYAIPGPPDPIVITATLAGLPSGAHVLEAEGQPSAGGAATVKVSGFAVVEPFTREADVLASAGTPPPGPFPGTPHGPVALGEALAAPPVGITGGGELRAGFVPAAQGRAGGP